MAALSDLYVAIISTAKDFAGGFDQASAEVKKFQETTNSANTALGKGSQQAAEATSLNMGLVAGAVAGAAVLVGGTLLKLSNDTAAFGEKLTDMASRTGISVEELQKLGFAAEQNGSTMDQMAKGLEFLSRQAYAAAGGSGEASKLFTTLGISVRDSNGNLKTSSEIFVELSDRISKMQDGTGKTAIAMAFLGRGVGADLVPTLNLGSEGLRAMGSQLENVGGLMSGETAQAGDIFRDKLDLLYKATGGLGDQVGILLIPRLIALIEIITPLVAKFTEWANTARDLSANPLVSFFLNTGKAAATLQLHMTGLSKTINEQGIKEWQNMFVGPELPKEPPPIIDKTRHGVEKLTEAQKTLQEAQRNAARIMAQERDEINKQGVALMNAEAAWAQYNATMAQMPSREALRNLETINEIIERNERILQNSPLSSGRIPLAQFPIPLDFGPIPTASTTGPFRKPDFDPAEQAKRIAEEQRKLADAVKDVERSAGKVFDALFLNKAKEVTGSGIISALDAELSKSGKVQDIRKNIAGQQTLIEKEEQNIADSQAKIAAQEKIIGDLQKKRFRSAADNKAIADANKIIQQELLEIAESREKIETRRGQIIEYQQQIEAQGPINADMQIQKLREAGIVLDANQEKWYRMALAEEQMAEQMKFTKAIDEYAAAHQSKWAQMFESIQTAAKGFAITMGRSIFQTMAGQLFGPLKKGFDDFFKGLLDTLGLDDFLKGIGKKLGDVFKNKALDSVLGAGGSAAQAAGSAASVATSAAEAGASAAGGLASGLISAAGGIIGGGLSALGTMRLEGTMNAVEYNTRASEIHLRTMIDQILWPISGHVLAMRESSHLATTQLDAIWNSLQVPGAAVPANMAMATAGPPTFNLNAVININMESAEVVQDPSKLKDAIITAVNGVIETGWGGFREKWGVAFSQTKGNVSTAPSYG